MEFNQLDQNFVWKRKGLKLAKKILKKNNKVKRFFYQV